MSFRKDPLKLFFLIFAIVLSLGILSSVISKEFKDRGGEKLSGGVEYLPQIVNSPSRSVEVESEFYFVPKIVPFEGSMNIELFSSPEWLSFDGVAVRGVPSETGAFEFVLRLEKEGRYVDNEFYLIVIDALDE